MQSTAILFLFVFSLASASSCEFSFTSKDCRDISTYSDCMNSINADILDTTKCIPLAEGSEAPCESWDNVEEGGFEVDYEENHAELTQQERADIEQLKWVAFWGQYPYYVHDQEALLEDQSILEDSQKGTLAVVGYHSQSNYVIASFRGSDNIQNWLANLELSKVPYVANGCKDCQVHKGFLESYQSIQEQVLAAYYEVRGKHPGAATLVTGHSLGSAESTFLAVDLVSQGHEVEFYSYGCPRPGDENYAKFFNNVVQKVNLRTVYRNDPVPTVPSHALGFEHVGSEVFFLDCENYLAFPKFKDPFPFMDILAVDDHSQYGCLAQPDKLMEIFQ